MIQPARSAKSRSLLREARSAIFFFDDENIRTWFKKANQEMIDKRNNPNLVHTGATELRTNLLAYLRQQGEIHTSNVWCRKIVYSEIRDFLNELENHLKQEGFNGVLELHLQDREINSPHIQYVGTDAYRAERMIADIIVKRGYEYSVMSAMNMNYIPAYISDEKKHLRIKETDEELDRQDYLKEQFEYKEEIKRSIKADLEQIATMKSSFLNILKEMRYQSSKTTQMKRSISYKERNKTTKELIDSWKEKSKARKKRK